MARVSPVEFPISGSAFICQAAFVAGKSLEPGRKANEAILAYAPLRSTNGERPGRDRLN
jgi:hypothetical protein